MTSGFTDVNGVSIAYQCEGQGPPLVLIMGYRLNSSAWPTSFIAQLARRFTVVTLDNRGTGRSDRPVTGYAIDNMARDVRQVLDDLGLDQVHLLGYSMGGAIAQEFVRQFPHRVKGLILCATMAGGPGAIYAAPSVVSVMRDLDGLSPEQAARRIWQVTYAPAYLERHREAAEAQMKREIASPTPLHAADLQFQAFAEFDGSRQLAAIRNPTLVFTGDLDRLISPRNSRKMAGSIPGARLILLPGCGHRVMWEATDECVEHICTFLDEVDGGRVAATNAASADNAIAAWPDTLVAMPRWLAEWSASLSAIALDSLAIARQSLLAGSFARYGDGKPVVLVPLHPGGDLALLPCSLWLRALGYRPVIASLSFAYDASDRDRGLLQSILEITERVGRKAVIVAHWSGMAQVQQVTGILSDRISDVIVVGGRLAAAAAADTHAISSDWTPLQTIAELPGLLRRIGLQLIDGAPRRTRQRRSFTS